jgi:hypothetical protein
MDGREEAAVTGVLCVHVCISDSSAAAGPGSSPTGVFRRNEIRVSLYTIHRSVTYFLVVGRGQDAARLVCCETTLIVRAATPSTSMQYFRFAARHIIPPSARTLPKNEICD